jgi:hypothetical protein
MISFLREVRTFEDFQALFQWQCILSTEFVQFCISESASLSVEKSNRKKEYKSIFILDRMRCKFSISNILNMITV